MYIKVKKEHHVQTISSNGIDIIFKAFEDERNECVIIELSICTYRELNTTAAELDMYMCLLIHS